MVKAVEAVLDGKLFFPHPEAVECPLTSREIQIIELLGRGKSNKEVAMELNISLRTAEMHRASIMIKLELRSVQELMRYAVKNRLVEV
jgi:DNA-binding NarL/FixJ family response regulator